MHLPSHLLSTEVSLGTAVAAAGAVAACGWRLRRDAQRPDGLRFAAVASLVFAAQMVNFPVAVGASGHLVGGVLAGAVLGPAAGTLALALVLAVQCLLFGDGGLAALGANVLNMAVLATWTGAAIGSLIESKSNTRPAIRMATLLAAAWTSVLAAAALCSIELAASGTFALADVLPPMLAVHAVIGLAEACLTAAAVLIERQAAPAGAEQAVQVRRQPAFVLLAAVLIVAVLAPVASALPDGLEAVVASLGASEAEPSYAAPLPDYEVPVLSGGPISTIAAGLIGVFAIGVVGFMVIGTTMRKGSPTV